jgi:hypothetical protein
MADTLKEEVAVADPGFESGAEPKSPPEQMSIALGALRGWLDDGAIARLQDRQFQRPNWQALRLAFKCMEADVTPMSAYLQALQAAVRLRRRAPLSTRYPPDSLHVREIRDALADGRSVARQQRLLKLFATDLYEQRVLDLNLLKYLLVQCVHEAEERQFRTLLSLLKERCHGQTATA